MDTSRQVEAFDPDDLKHPVTVVGCGATGGRIALGLVRHGVKRIHAYDFDIVSEHNLCNQPYFRPSIGVQKCLALGYMAEEVDEETGIGTVSGRIHGASRLSGCVFLCTDTMESRCEIYEGALKSKPAVEVVIETRMGMDSGRVYCFNPNIREDQDKWTATLCRDDVAEVSACGTSINVGATADIVSGLALWQLFKWVNHAVDKGPKPEFELIFAVRPSLYVLSRE